MLRSLRPFPIAVAALAFTAAACGMLAAAVSLGMTEFVAGTSGGRSLIVSVGDWVILHAPHALVDFAKRNFGTNDKTVLVAGIIVTSLLFGIGIGLIARHAFRI